MTSRAVVLDELVGDPVTHRPGFQGPILDGVPRGVVADEVIVGRYGRRALEAWKVVQAEGERSYEEVGPVGNFSVESWEPAIEAAEVFVATADEPAIVLDVGCGLLPEPSYVKVLRSSWRCQVVGVDPILGEPRSFLFVQALGDFLPFRAGAFDAVLFVSTLDHMISPLHALRGARQVLRPGGWLLVEETVRSVDRLYRRWRARRLVGPARYNAFHNHAFVPKTLRRVVERGGFEVDEMRHSSSDPREMIVFGRAPT